MEIERARDDVLVAGAAAGTTVALAVAPAIGPVVDVGTIATLSPLLVYFAYRLSRAGGPYGGWDTARNWAIGAVAVGLAVLVAAAL